MRSRMVRASMYGAGLVMMVGCLSSTVLAGAAVAVPEIDGGTLSSGVAALSAAILILRARRRTK